MTRPRRPRVLILVENLPVPLDRRAWQEARALHAAGWDVTVISPKGAGDMAQTRDRIDGITVLRYPQRAARGLRGYLFEYGPSILFSAAFALYARTHGRFDVVHGCNPPDLFWLFGAAARLEGGHFVFDQHDVGPELAATKWGRSGAMRARLLLRITRWLEARSYRTASLVLAPNASYRDIAIGRGDVDADRVLVVRNAPDVARYRDLAAGVEPDPHRIGYVGVMGSQDGLDVLLEAWALVCAEPDMRDARLDLVGDGEARPDLEAQAQALGISSRLTFHGFLRAERFVPIIAACAAGVSPDLPTPFNDVSTMVKVVDYLAIGRGTVAFDLAETRKVAGEAAVISMRPTAAGLADALLAVMRDPEQARVLGAAATARITAIHLDWSESAAVLCDGYARVLGRTPAPRVDVA